MYERAVIPGSNLLSSEERLEAAQRMWGLMILYQMDNDDGLWLPAFLSFLSEHDQQLHALNSPPLAFALAVVAARRRGDFDAFFKLLRAAPFVEANGGGSRDHDVCVAALFYLNICPGLAYFTTTTVSKQEHFHST